MLAEISPVKAPSFSQNTSCAEIAIFVCFAASTAVGMAVKGGAITISQCVEEATKGANAEKKARVSACVLNIFQLPAMTRRRIQTSHRRKEKDNAEARRTLRFRREEAEVICWSRLQRRGVCVRQEIPEKHHRRWRYVRFYRRHPIDERRQQSLLRRRWKWRRWRWLRRRLWRFRECLWQRQAS